MRKIPRWKSFDFGPETSIKENGSPLEKRRSLDRGFKSKIDLDSKNNSTKNNFEFHKKMEPHSVADLIVHPKKIQELEHWLRTIILKTKEREKTEFLLLSGPTGSGKSTAVQMLCKSLNIDTVEWTNPVDVEYDLVKGPSQIFKFLDFFSESKYCSLFSKQNNHKVLLVKDFPNAVVRNSDEFHRVLEEVSYKATHPVIFICTDSASSELNLQKSLFPEDILLKYSISHISFNACAPSLLKKGLKRAADVLRLYPELFQVPSPSTVDAILASSMGDIRCAINQLYLNSIIGVQDVSVVKLTSEKTGSKRKRKDQPMTLKHMNKDETLGLFHGLGRVLNPKRKEEGESWRLCCDVQKLIDEFSIQPSMFTAFLFENYLKYFTDLHEIQKSADHLSFSTSLLENWDNHDTLVIALWISVLGVMVFNKHKASKWNQIKGPKRINKICSNDSGSMLHPTDRFYYNLINKSDKYHRFNCNI